MEDSNNTSQSRRKFVQQTSLAGAGIMLAGPLDIFARAGTSVPSAKTIKSKGYAAKDALGMLHRNDIHTTDMANYNLHLNKLQIRGFKHGYAC